MALDFGMELAAPNGMAPSGQPAMMRREAPEPADSRRQLVTQWCQKVQRAKGIHDKAFRRMRDDMKFVDGLQWPNQTCDDDRYLLNICLRHSKNRTARLYAKNPTVQARRSRKLDFAIWDEDPNTLLQALQTVQMLSMGAQSGMIGPEITGPLQEATALIQDYNNGMRSRRMIDKIGKTLEIVQMHFMAEQTNGFKSQMKQLVRREGITGVGYVKIDFQRIKTRGPVVDRQLSDHYGRLKTLERMIADQADGITDSDSAEAETLKHTISRIEEAHPLVLREGLVYAFPKSDRIIPDPETQYLTGWVGTGWIAEEFITTPDKIKENYGKDIGDHFTRYTSTGQSSNDASFMSAAWAESSKEPSVCGWEVYDKETGNVFTIIDGYPDFIEEPRAPNIKVEGFFQHLALATNQSETGELFPRSDINLLRHPQMDINRAREARRQHRIAARPLYAAGAGVLEDDEYETMEHAPAHAIMTLKALAQGQKVTDVFQPVQKIGLDPNLYEIQGSLNDFQLASGSQEASLGLVSGGTATEASIAQGSEQTVTASSGDEVDEFLTEIVRKSGQVAMAELSAETVMKIAGPGAVWPEQDLKTIQEELHLQVRAGSSGKPNRGAEISNFNMMFPFLQAVPGLSMRKLAEHGVGLLSDNIEVVDFLDTGAPSMVALNQSALNQKSADPSKNPDNQGSEGSAKAQPDGASKESMGPGNPAPGTTSRDMSNSGI